MIHVSVKDLYRPKYVVLWMILSLKAGFLNATGFLATGFFVSHVTGFGTQMGVSLAHEDYLFGSELLLIPGAFILGSSVPGWILDRNYSEKEIPKYHYVQFLITLCLGIIFFFGVSGGLGDFWTRELDQHDAAIIAALCFVLGMKNGLTTWSTYGKIRTTHLTGLATDIGLHLPKFFGKSSGSRFPEARRVNVIRILTFLSFSTGSLIAAFMLPAWQYYGFLFPFSLSVILSVISYLNYLHYKNELIQGELCKL